MEFNRNDYSSDGTLHLDIKLFALKTLKFKVLCFKD